MERLPLRRSLFVALFVTVTWAAAVFAVAGLLAVLLDRDPVQTDAGPVYVGLIGLALAGVAVWLIVGHTARARRPWLGALAAAAAVYLIIAAASLVVSFAMFAEQAASPFVIAAAVLAAAAVVATWAVLRSPPKAGLSSGRPSA
jgi:hypothetical protein